MTRWKLVGDVGLGDPPCADSAPLVAKLRAMGVRRACAR
ncbi:hypothetical protein UKMH10_4851 [Burkholderia pseudomallei]|uniref:Uncharacterized protein n=3 Tax=Burkholderia pseudomallei TaxID=28450 RepID=Q3JMJ2_BURP1|nr:hypothetical protein BURPS1710b_A0052 [Burkholderia pseudomallei 1710b]ABN85614.1 hypothetical protein BURPS668_A1552 [Burkholderia pseudomallei 668]ABN93385.1 hypothetical protein BURPS1106A_A1465 [Burkholderia pseudomallei 1106a]AFR19396.1 hypothetical protein BPC006_II1469 [Burkholderia pseudomallei BPC006]EDO93520.1 hypothetical protein BURPSPAST_J0804 [Burkholderia pseudomallei Pasteur 52237]EEH24592.1 hypothetical protein BUH_5787 [Burkholderia pseudomallei Pakistan 9]EES21630.1 hypo